MTGASYLKQPRGRVDDVAEYLSLLRGSLVAAEWTGARENISRLDRAWKRVVPRIQYAVERDEINRVSVGIARSRGYITARDRAGALAELYEVETHWDNIGE